MEDVGHDDWYDAILVRLIEGEVIEPRPTVRSLLHRKGTSPSRQIHSNPRSIPIFRLAEDSLSESSCLSTKIVSDQGRSDGGEAGSHTKFPRMLDLTFFQS